MAEINSEKKIEAQIKILEEVIKAISQAEVTIPERFRTNEIRVRDFCDGVTAEHSAICHKLYDIVGNLRAIAIESTDVKEKSNG